MATDPPLHPCDDAPPHAELSAAVAERLAEGGVVALPSEAAYLVVARADLAAAVDAVRAMARDGRVVRLLTGADALAGVVARDGSRWPLAPLAMRVARRYWPGPLVLELEGADPAAPAIAADGWTRFLAVAHRATAGLVAAAPTALVAAEAHRADGAPAVTADEVVRVHGARVAWVADGGRARLGEDAAVLAIGRGRFELVREGLLALDELRSAAGLSIGFVCTGNTCRSPMAEGLAKAELTRRLGSERHADFGFRVTSAGVGASSGAPAAAHAIEVLAGRRIDLSGHRSRPATPEDVGRLDRVYGLTRGHLDALVAGLPPGRAQHVELLDPDGVDVPDPIGGSRADYERCAERLEAAIARRADEWA